VGRYLDRIRVTSEPSVGIESYEINEIRRNKGVPDTLEASPKFVDPAIPPGAILLALRYDGGRPCLAPPKCYCCGTSYVLDRLEEAKSNVYAFLEPGCECLDARMCYVCFVCREHCTCESKDRRFASSASPETAKKFQASDEDIPF
jgi:hypothetical protein